MEAKATVESMGAAQSDCSNDLPTFRVKQEPIDASYSDNKKITITDVDSRITSLRDMLAQSESRAKKADEDRARAQADLLKWIDNSSESDRLRLRAERQLAKEREEMASKLAAIESGEIESERAKMWRGKYEAQLKNVEAAKEELEVLKKEAKKQKDLQEQLQQSQRAESELRDRAAGLAASLHGSEMKRMSLSQALEEVKNAKEELQFMLDGASAQAQTAQRDREELTAAREREKAEAASALEQLQLECERLRKEWDDLESVPEKAVEKKEADGADWSIDAWRKKAEMHQSALEQAREQLQQLQQSHERLQQPQSVLQARAAALTDMLHAACADRTRMWAELEAAKAAAAELQLLLQQTSARAEAAERSREEIYAEKERLRLECERLTKDAELLVKPEAAEKKEEEEEAVERSELLRSLEESKAEIKQLKKESDMMMKVAVERHMKLTDESASLKRRCGDLEAAKDDMKKRLVEAEAEWAKRIEAVMYIAERDERERTRIRAESERVRLEQLQARLDAAQTEADELRTVNSFLVTTKPGELVEELARLRKRLAETESGPSKVAPPAGPSQGHREEEEKDDEDVDEEVERKRTRKEGESPPPPPPPAPFVLRAAAVVAPAAAAAAAFPPAKWKKVQPSMTTLVAPKSNVVAKSTTFLPMPIRKKVLSERNFKV